MAAAPPPPPSPGIWRWHDRYDDPVAPDHRFTLGEGGTPLLPSRRIGPGAGLERLYFKLESSNPTGSYKDRFAAAAISRMLAAGQSACVATSSGNTGAALAAACAASGLRCLVALVETAPWGKLKQMLAHGAELYRVRGFGLDPSLTAAAFAKLKELAARPGHALQISAYAFSPTGMSGVESIAHELDEQLPGGSGPRTHVFCPAGGGGLALAVARGFLRVPGGISPAVHCVQPEGNDTIAGPLREGRDHGRKIARSATAVSGLQVPTLLDASALIAACRASGGTGHLVSDALVLEAQRRLAREEGVFSEPAGAVALAGAIQAAARGELDPAAPVVCLVTGSGFKDEASLDLLAGGPEAAPLLSLDEFAALA